MQSFKVDYKVDILQAKLPVVKISKVTDGLENYLSVDEHWSYQVGFYDFKIQGGT